MSTAWNHREAPAPAGSPQGCPPVASPGPRGCPPVASPAGRPANGPAPTVGPARGNNGPAPTVGPARGNNGPAPTPLPAAPVKCTTTTPARPSGHSNGYVPKPAIDDAAYETALHVLRTASDDMEQYPGTWAKLGEEDLRNCLLSILNSHFKGAAAGEVFNGAGRTDILVRLGNRKVFIGECKIYDPKNNQSVEHVVTSALDQLLNRYLVPSDNKAALLLFIRDPNVSDIMGKALASIGSHPNHLRRPVKIGAGERYDFVLHAKGDKNREIRLAFLPFPMAARPQRSRPRRKRGSSERPGRPPLTSTPSDTPGSKTGAERAGSGE